MVPSVLRQSRITSTALRRSPRYCLYSPTFKQFVFRPRLVERMAEAVEKYQALLCRAPVAKGSVKV